MNADDSLTKTEVISEADLDPTHLEPSDTFARLLVRVGGETAVGALGLDAIRKRVHERAASAARSASYP